MRKMTIVITVIAALVITLGIGIGIVAGELAVQPEVLAHDEVEFRSPIPMPPSLPFQREIHRDIDTTPTLAGLLRPGVSNITPADIGFEITMTDEVHSLSDVGKPGVPYIIKKFKIPRESEVESVSVNLSNPVEIHNIFIEPQQPPVPVIFPPPPPPEYTIDTEIYSSHELYPGKEYVFKESIGIDLNTHLQVKSVVVYIFPIQYIPSENKVVAYKNATISLSITPPPSKSSALAPRPLGAGEEYECVIITHPDFADECEELADWKTITGISTKVVNTTWIDTHFTGFDGTDLPAKIKDFIDQSVTDWNTEYIILAGDIDKVPTRYAYVNDSSGEWWDAIDGEYVPCDLYYADLCDWDTNDDGKYGAIGPDVDTDIIDVDPNVYIGRLPASSESELNTLINKIIAYERDAYNSDWVKKATLVADDVCFNASDYLKDQTVQHFENWGVPSANIQKLYGTSINADDVQNAINAGRGFVNYGGHGYYNAWSCQEYTNGNVNLLTNGGKTPIIGTMACLTAGFDMPGILECPPDITPPISEDCIGEKFLLKHNGGGVTYLGATRVTWGYNTTTWIDKRLAGYVDKMFWYAIENHDTIGECWKYAITAEADRGDTSISSRKVLTEYVLLGDPSLRIRGQIYFVDDFERYDTGDAYTQSAFVERWDIDESADEEWRVDIDEHSGNKVLAIDEDGGSIGHSCIISVWRSIAEDWTDYTLDADLRFAAGDYEWVPFIGISGRHFEDTVNEMWGAYVVELWYRNGAAVKIWKLVDSDDPGYVCGDSPEDVMECIGSGVLPTEMSDLIPARDWLHMKVGFATDPSTGNLTITAYVTADEGVDGNVVIVSAEDGVDVIEEGGVGLFTAAYPGQVLTTEFDNVIVTKGCIFNDQLESETFSNDAWIPDPADSFIIENGTLRQDSDYDNNFVMENIYSQINHTLPPDAIFEADVNLTSDYLASYTRTGIKFDWSGSTSSTEVLVYLGRGGSPTVTGLHVIVDDPEDPGEIHIPINNLWNKRHHLKILVPATFDYLGYENNVHAYVYLNGKLMAKLDDYGERHSSDSTLSLDLFTLWASAYWDNIYVENLVADFRPPQVQILYPSDGATVSGIITVETTVSDTGGSGISHSALYTNDTLVAVNISSANPTFQFDTSLLPAGDCTLTVVAVDNAGNSKWTAIAINVMLPMEGDVNGDRHVTIADSILLQGYLANPAAHPLNDSQLTSANTYEIAPDPSTIDIYDVMYIQKWLLDPSTPLWDEEHDQGITVPPQP